MLIHCDNCNTTFNNNKDVCRYCIINPNNRKLSNNYQNKKYSPYEDKKTTQQWVKDELKEWKEMNYTY